MKTDDAITVLRELAKNANKRSKIGQIRELMPYIEEAMKSGVTLADIHAALIEKCGIDIKLMTFIGSYKRIKKERKEGIKKPASTPQEVTPKEESTNILQPKPQKQISSEDKKETKPNNPFAKKQTQDGDLRRSNFDYNPKPDKTKIYGDNNDE